VTAGRGAPWAIFDIDKTITKRPTWSHFLEVANEGRPMTKLRLGAALVRAGASYGFRFGDRTGVKEAALRSGLAGRSEDELKPLAAAFAAEVVKTGLRPRAREVIEAHRAAGHRLAVASAAVDLIVDPLCDALGIETQLCTSMLWEDGVLQDRFGGPNCYADEKERQVRKLLSHDGGTLQAFYSDHVSDAGLLRLAVKGVAVNPSPALKALAAAEGLETADWDQEAAPVSVPA
jgi:HAD superfamily hydrolase (TIGR01490 family)